MFVMSRQYGLLLIFALAGQAQQATPEQETVFRAGVSVVRVDAQVVDGNRVVSGLMRADFRIFDEGQPQAIEYFARDTEPLWLLLLLDVSGSMRKRLEEMAAVGRKALRPLAPGDHVGVMFFGRNTTVAREFTENAEDAATALGQASREKDVGSGTAINPSVISAANYVRENVRNRPGRRAIMILTDNEGLNYQLRDETVLEALFSADAVLNAIVTPDAKPPSPAPAAANPDFTRSDVFKLARESGGEVMKAERTGEAFQQMIERIRTRYSLHYRSPEATPGAVRRIRVELSPEVRRRFSRAEVRARTGYAVPK